MKIPSNSTFPLQCKNMSRHKVTSSFGFKEFEGSQDEVAFWNASKEDEKSSLKRKHVDTGECLLCIIDELIPQKPKQLEKPKEAEHQRAEPASRKIVGGIILRAHEKVEVSTQNLKVSWAWYSEAQGIVAWSFQNTSSQQASCILLRNSYYFGNAFWMIYENNPSFGTSFATKLEPLVDNTIQKNSAPIGVISWKQVDGSYKNIIGFIFTIAPGQTWQMLEGGFSGTSPPAEVSAYEVCQISEDDFWVGYDKQQVSAWERQTGSKLQGYSPNPSTLHSIQVLAPAEAPFIALFSDTIVKGKCESVAQTQETPPEQSNPASQTESRFWSLLARNAGTLN